MRLIPAPCMAQYLAAPPPHGHHRAGDGTFPGMMMFYDGLMDGFNDAIAGNAVRVLGGNVQVHAAGYREKVDSNPLLPLADDSAVVQSGISPAGCDRRGAAHPNRRTGQQP